MKIGLIAIDVDGTLLADDHLTIPQINIEALQEAHRNNVKVAICSGRTASLVEKEVEELSCIDFLVISNGAAVVETSTMNVIYSCYLKKETVIQIVDILEKYPVVYELYAEGEGYISENSKEHYFETAGLPMVFMKEYIKRITSVDNIKNIPDKLNVEKVNINYLPTEYRVRVMEELSSVPELVYAAGFEGNVEMTAIGADKGATLAWLADRIGLRSENVMAFGDSSNDVTMLGWAENSYAMKNGNAKAKAAAKYITKKSNGEGGLGETIRETILAR